MTRQKPLSKREFEALDPCAAHDWVYSDNGVKPAWDFGQPFLSALKAALKRMLGKL